MVCCCFFFKQKTAYEMRISDWSSDVCSSDLICASRPGCPCPLDAGTDRLDERRDVGLAAGVAEGEPQRAARLGVAATHREQHRSEERRVGKECVVRVDLGGRRIIKKKSKTTNITKICLSNNHTIKN